MVAVTRVQTNAGSVSPATPAFVVANPLGTTLDSTPNAGLSIFANPVPGNVDTGVTHEGDLGGAG